MDLATAQAKLAAWQSADDAIQKGQSYAIDGMQLSRVDADMVSKKIDYWQRVVNEHIDIDSGREPGYKVARWN